jgi:ferredoxin
MPRLVSVNVGLPQDIEWKGRTVHTGIWKDPVRGRCRVSRLNLDGDGQGDVAGHGGEQRAVFVYQLESYRYWQEQLKRNDFVCERKNARSWLLSVSLPRGRVSFARSGIAAHWNATAYQSLLELAEACDVPVRWSCRTGVCHNCESGLVSGAVVYGPEPLDNPADGNLLVCRSQPIRDVVIDL